MYIVCFTAADGRRICFHIPEYIQKFHFGPDPDPALVIGRGTGDPWVFSEGISRETASRLSSMSTIMRVAEHLDGQLANTLGKVFSEQIDQMHLPEGVQVEMMKQHAG